MTRFSALSVSVLSFTALVLPACAGSAPAASAPGTNAMPPPAATTGAASAADAADVNGTIDRWVADMNAANWKSFFAACAPRVAVVDGFPPYAWLTCDDWIRDYRANNERTQATLGHLSSGKPAYTEMTGDRAYWIVPVTFSNTQQGKPVTYKGSWTMTLQKTASGWLFTGAASSWDANSL